MTDNDKEFAEKRDYIRMFIDAPVEFCLSGKDEWHKGLAKDLSGGGLSFVTELELNPGQSVIIRLEPVTPVTPPLEAKVTIIRAVADGNGQYEVSSRIEQILDTNQ